MTLSATGRPAAPARAESAPHDGDPSELRVQDLDLNLLKTFRAVYEERHVGRAALRLGVTQPSVSYALGRLRLMFRDALFVRTGTGVEPTPRAQRLALSVDKALAILQHVLDEGSRFTPDSTQRVFRLHMSDFAASAFLPTLLAEFDRRAPGAVIETLHVDECQLNVALESGRIDFALGHFADASSHFQRAALLHERCVLLMPRRTAQRVGLPDDYVLDGAAPDTLRFVAVTSHPQSMQLLERHGLMPRVRAALPDFMVVPALLQDGDYALILPETIAITFAARQPCALYEIAGAGEWAVNAYWHRRFDADPGHRWLRALLLELFNIGELAPFDAWLAPQPPACA
ncbi:LysR family transcriptional regulator [Burkholderia puraquae]|uniref:LysR family transcriptional regulator n=1 Tax=Burkholderia puraquae TaxID=1904757 RepID=A0A1X1PDZ3_9BURK|nr:LysR family transcriptional regulator [Burkholderia puraquae]ORT84084.1 LysR family transcriptional regulator [Burkholderia puraquae]CAB3753114.1 PCP degradation transcriptional activation protein [Burkholderia puraquae]